jgi:hypothetical protein
MLAILRARGGAVDRSLRGTPDRVPDEHRTAVVEAVEPEDVGGDPACWVRLECPASGRLADEDPPTRCPACGELVEAD